MRVCSFVTIQAKPTYVRIGTKVVKSHFLPGTRRHSAESKCKWVHRSEWSVGTVCAVVWWLERPCSRRHLLLSPRKLEGGTQAPSLLDNQPSSLIYNTRAS
jgi:hypothetical protein